MWYDTSDNSSSHTLPFTLQCDGGSESNTQTDYERGVFRNSRPFGVSDIPDDFGPEMSGVYQCAMWDRPDKSVWYQRTTYVVVAGM